ncbi:probable transcriptional repressor of the fructose operon [Brevibacillus brevis NBRC 100599]|uniref:Probable transcriptional repressor of the fructose operon n=1 Tax=Brevibacillus brevis (strain 47 / JCM 6285 / NBRC 100599) TaxID=358681 RepID=C0Z9W5_BREBN|nr:DeoR/GlpR family DNA-binding transcription regulator [Brevibacillus brevis]BAH46819.1 probable transcriptional repressor of the fructose operon [Brevibacillus brevis NBRC 100599]
MLTPERHQLIVALVEEKDIVRIHELVEATGASESTIRRDLSELEEQRLLKRVHGGASVLQSKIEEPTILEKSVKHEREKLAIAKYAASLIKPHDSIFIDAGTTTYQMLPYLPYENIMVVTNGVDIALQLIKRNIRTILLGGELKAATLSMVGRDAITALSQYRFDKCFLGTNGIDQHHGLTTPDPDEAYVKQLALQFSDERFVLTDSDKFSRVTFAKVGDLQGITVITDDGLSEEEQQVYGRLSTLKVVKA